MKREAGIVFHGGPRNGERTIIRIEPADVPPNCFTVAVIQEAIVCDPLPAPRIGLVTVGYRRGMTPDPDGWWHYRVVENQPPSE